MDIGIGLPSSVPGTSSADVVGWARQAETAGFTRLGALDRLVYDSYEPLTTLAAAAAVTERIGLMTSVLLAPLHANPALLAKQCATLVRLSNGRFTLGAGVGARADDYQAGGLSMADRGARLESMLEDLTRLWEKGESGVPFGPGPAPGRPGGPGLVLGGHAPAAIERAARRGSGWIAGAAGPAAFGRGAQAVRDAWTRHGRSGVPRLAAIVYFALGPDGERTAESYLTAYYRSAGPFAAIALSAAACTPARVRTLISEYTSRGCDELIFLPCTADGDQVARLADIAC